MLEDMLHTYFPVLWNQNCIHTFKRFSTETWIITSSFLMLPSPLPCYWCDTDKRQKIFYLCSLLRITILLPMANWTLLSIFCKTTAHKIFFCFHQMSLHEQYVGPSLISHGRTEPLWECMEKRVLVSISQLRKRVSRVLFFIHFVFMLLCISFFHNIFWYYNLGT